MLYLPSDRMTGAYEALPALSYDHACEETPAGASEPPRFWCCAGNIANANTG